MRQTDGLGSGVLWLDFRSPNLDADGPCRGMQDTEDVDAHDHDPSTSAASSLNRVSGVETAN